MIQDIAPSQMDIVFADKEPHAGAVVLAFFEGALLCAYDGEEISYPLYEMLGCSARYLFCIDTTDYFICFEKQEAVPGFQYVSMGEVRRYKTSGRKGLFAAFTAWHLWDWYEGNRFCGHCGHAMEYDTQERAMLCPLCKKKVYPRINPAVIIAIRNGEKLMITKYRRGYGHSALVAGFIEIGETLEDTVRREVMEEVGLKVRNIRYYKSQPWGIAADLLAGFYCDVDGSDEIRMDEGELRYAQWVERDEIELQPNDISLTNEMMRMFKEGQM